MRYILGIDQGSTKTTTAVSDLHGDILAASTTVGAIFSVDGMEKFMKVTGNAVKTVLQAAGLDICEVGIVVAGLTGADWPYEYEILRKALFELTGVEEIKVFNDCVPALWAGTEKNYGVILCAGSAFNAAVVDKQGNEFVYSYYVEEEDHSAAALGRKAVRAAISSSIGLIEPTELVASVLSHFEIEDAEQLLFKRINGTLPMDKTIQFAPKLFELAYNGDAVSQRLVKTFSERIANYAITGIQRFHMQEDDVDVVLSGGIFKVKNPILVDTVKAKIKERLPRATVVNAYYEPVVGSIIVGLQKLNNSPVEGRIRECILASAKKNRLIRMKE